MRILRYIRAAIEPSDGIGKLFWRQVVGRDGNGRKRYSSRRSSRNAKKPAGPCEGMRRRANRGERRGRIRRL